MCSNIRGTSALFLAKRTKFERTREAAYQPASEWTRTPAPGPAQLRLAQGQVEAANAAIRRIAEEVRDAGPRARVLDAYIEIVLAVNDVAAARVAAEELSGIATRWDAAFLRTLACRARGAVRSLPSRDMGQSPVSGKDSSELSGAGG